MKKHPALLLFVILFMVSLACSTSGLQNVSDIGITQCTLLTGEKTITCQSAKSDLSVKSQAKFNFSVNWGPAGASVAHVTLHLSVAGQGQAQASVKTTSGQTLTVQASNGNPGEISADIPLTLEHVRSAAEATRTGMDMDNKYFTVIVEPLGGTKAEGVQINMDVNLGT